MIFPLIFNVNFRQSFKKSRRHPTKKLQKIIFLQISIFKEINNFV